MCIRDRSTGAAVIFGATGGVMEAALRTAVEVLTGEELANLDFTDVRGTQGVKEMCIRDSLGIAKAGNQGRMLVSIGQDIAHHV